MADPSLSPAAAGNAANLFPTLDPQPTPSAPSAAAKSRAKPVANTSALPDSGPVVGAQVVGLSALALAFVLAVTRVSIRRRPAAKPDAAAKPGAAKPGTEGKPETDAKPETDPKPGPEEASNPEADETGNQPDAKEAPPETPATDEE